MEPFGDRRAIVDLAAAMERIQSLPSRPTSARVTWAKPPSDVVCVMPFAPNDVSRVPSARKRVTKSWRFV